MHPHTEEIKPDQKGDKGVEYKKRQEVRSNPPTQQKYLGAGDVNNFQPIQFTTAVEVIQDIPT